MQIAVAGDARDLELAVLAQLPVGDDVGSLPGVAVNAGGSGIGGLRVREGTDCKGENRNGKERAHESSMKGTSEDRTRRFDRL